MIPWVEVFLVVSHPAPLLQKLHLPPSFLRGVMHMFPRVVASALSFTSRARGGKSGHDATLSLYYHLLLSAKKSWCHDDMTALYNLLGAI